MLKRLLVAISTTLAVPLVATSPATPLDSAARQEVVAALAAALRERYVFPTSPSRPPPGSRPRSPPASTTA